MTRTEADVIAECSVETQFRQVLANMEVWLQYGTTVSLEPATSHGELSYGRPPGDAWPPHVVWRAKWLKASVLEHHRLLREATDELERLLERKQVVVVEETQPELEARMVKEGRGWEVKQVAQHFNCTPTFVRRVRLAAAVNGTTGEPESAAPDHTIDQAKRARELAEDGLSERQIRMILKCGGSKLQRLLSEAA